MAGWFLSLGIMGIASVRGKKARYKKTLKLFMKYGDLHMFIVNSLSVAYITILKVL